MELQSMLPIMHIRLTSYQNLSREDRLHYTKAALDLQPEMKGNTEISWKEVCAAVMRRFLRIKIAGAEFYYWEDVRNL